MLIHVYTYSYQQKELNLENTTYTYSLKVLATIVYRNQKLRTLLVRLYVVGYLVLEIEIVLIGPFSQPFVTELGMNQKYCTSNTVGVYF